MNRTLRYVFVTWTLMLAPAAISQQPALSMPAFKLHEEQTKEYYDLISQFQAVRTTWRNATEEERNEALKAWWETTEPKLRELQREMPSSMPPAQHAYWEAQHEYRKFLQENVNVGSDHAVNTSVNTDIEKKLKKLKILAEDAKIERAELEKKLSASERENREKIRMILEKDSAAQKAFIESLKSLSPAERHTAFKNWLADQSLHSPFQQELE